MTETSCQNPEEHCDLHACQLGYKERNPEIDKMFENPHFVCMNCGARVNDGANVCRPRPL
jgi:ribosomal protein L40E